MALSESRFRQILKEEARRVLREGAGKIATMDMVARLLRNMGEDDLADKVENYNLRSRNNGSMEFDERGDGVVKAYQYDNGRSGNYMFDIPSDVYKELKSAGLTDKRMSESRSKRVVLEKTRRPRRALREMDDDMGGGADAYLTIFDVSTLADNMDMGVEDFELMVQDVVEREMPGRIEFVGGDSGGRGPDPEPYSEEDDSYTVMGNKRDLKRLVSALEGEIQGPAQSIEDGEGLDYQITEF